MPHPDALTVAREPTRTYDTSKPDEGELAHVDRPRLSVLPVDGDLLEEELELA
jgi:hypothetical protein